MTLSLEQQIGMRVREVRTIKGLSQSDVAKSLGISYQQIQKYERGANRISVGLLLRLLHLLDIPPAHFFSSFEINGQGKLDRDPQELDSKCKLLFHYNRIPNQETQEKIYQLVRKLAKQEGEP